MKRLLVACAVGGLMFGAASCSTTYTKDELVTDLVNEGIPKEIATCVVDEVTAQGVPLKKFGEMSAEEEAKITEAATTCVTENPEATQEMMENQGS